MHVETRHEMDREKGLTERQKAFVQAYIHGPRRVRFCATRSAAEAGYRWPDKQGPRLLQFPAVAEATEAEFRAAFPFVTIGPDGRCM